MNPGSQPALRNGAHPPSKGFHARGFSILELLIATAILGMLVVLLANVLGQTSSATRRANETVTSFQNARAAFDLMTVNLSQATLNTYWDYQNAGGQFRTPSNRSSFQPATYGRISELHFLIQNSGIPPWPGTPGTGQMLAFQFPTDFATSSKHSAMNGLLSACSYYIEYSNEAALPSPFAEPAPKFRFRLMQALEPSEDFSVYDSPTGDAWVSSLASRAVPIADNVVYLLVWPMKTQAEDPSGQELTGNFTYDSRRDVQKTPQPETASQLPPLVQITMVCIDESSASRICTESTPPGAITNVFSDLFSASNQTAFAKDLKTLEQRLGAIGVNYRIFTSVLPIQESKMQ